jgi:hypothetical protein
MKDVKITWDKRAVERVKADALTETFKRIPCPDCGTAPRPIPGSGGRYACSCGKLEGVVT